MLCGEPVVVNDVVHCAVRLLDGPLSDTAAQSEIGVTLAPSKKSTVPVGAVPAAGEGAVVPSNATVAVKVTGSPLFNVPDAGVSVLVVLNKSTSVVTVLVSSGLPTNPPDNVP